MVRYLWHGDLLMVHAIGSDMTGISSLDSASPGPFFA
jgi:hypothetical protein